ncbi:hypothetical protein ACX80D_04810 [Arthrobacter sp. Sr24]
MKLPAILGYVPIGNGYWDGCHEFKRIAMEALFFVWTIHYGPSWSGRYRGHMDEAVNMNLVPSPEKLVALIDEIVTSGWPDRNDDQADYLLRLGFHQDEGAEGFCEGYGFLPAPESAVYLGGELHNADLAVSNATWSSFNGELFSVGFFLYDGRSSREDGAVLGYRFIYEQLLAMYGQPADATVGPFAEATSCWNLNGTTVEMYCHTRPTPVLQLGFGHIVRNTDYEARMV